MALALGTTPLAQGQIADHVIQNGDGTSSIVNGAGLLASCDPTGVITWVPGPPTAYQKCVLNGPSGVPAGATIATFTPDGQHTFDFAFHASAYSYA
jgi:hypothetical protein